MTTKLTLLATMGRLQVLVLHVSRIPTMEPAVVRTRMVLLFLVERTASEWQKLGREIGVGRDNETRTEFLKLHLIRKTNDLMRK